MYMDLFLKFFKADAGKSQTLSDGSCKYWLVVVVPVLGGLFLLREVSIFYR